MKINHLNSERSRELWLEQEGYPVTIIVDRYGGTYSGGDWVALPCYYHQIPDDGPDGDDISCMYFWKEYDGFCGLGRTPQEAFDNLVANVKNNRRYNE